jgi:hypothetical protein
VRELVFAQDNGGRAERVCLHHVAADIKKSRVNFFHRFRAADEQVFVAAFELRAAEIIGR